MILLPYPPSVNRVWRNCRGRMVMSAEGAAYKLESAWRCRSAGMKLLSGPVEVHMVLHPKKTKGGAASKTRIDLDNMSKVVLDAMNGVAYADDKQIERIISELGEPVQNGGVSVSVNNLHKSLDTGK